MSLKQLEVGYKALLRQLFLQNKSLLCRSFIAVKGVAKFKFPQRKCHIPPPPQTAMSLLPSNLYQLKSQIKTLVKTTKTMSQILQIHAQLITTNFSNNPFIVTQFLHSLVSKFPNNMAYADLTFTQFLEPNTYTYNTMIKGHVLASNPKRALKYYIEMRKNGILVDFYTYPFALKACGMMSGLWEGRGVHGEVVKEGFLWDVIVRNGLIGMYGRVGEMSMCRMLFDEFSGKDLVSWNLMLGGYVRLGEMREAQNLFDEMPTRDVVSWSIMVDGYGKKAGDVVRARELFDCMPMKDLISWNSMIYAYAKVGSMLAARQLFDKTDEKNLVSWSIMIDGYTQNGSPKESLDIFRQMLNHGVKPDKISVVGAISACGQLGALDQGRWIHMYMKKNKMKWDIVVQTALIDMYMKCGRTDEACAIFSNMTETNVVTWNVMIAGLGMNGLGRAALDCFDQMEMNGIPKDDLIFISVLTACSHTGLVTEGLNIFYGMQTYGIEPKIEHYGCLIDLLGRAGQLHKAKNVVESMSVEQNAELWGSLLLACRVHHNVTLAEVAVERLVELKADDSGVYVLMSNIYADAEVWEGVVWARKLVREKHLKKETGKSVVEIDGAIQEFISGQTSHIQSGKIDAVLWSLQNVEVSEE